MPFRSRSVPAVLKARPIDIIYAKRAKAHGSAFTLRIILEARRAGLPLSLAFALIEKESGFRNVWGHDKGLNASTTHLGGKLVTAPRYKTYKAARGTAGQGGMQGVGPAQLTWWEFQDEADARGGCWVPRHNISTAFDHLAALIRQHGTRRGLAKYNGHGSLADQYADSVIRGMDKWHKILTRKDPS